MRKFIYILLALLAVSMLAFSQKQKKQPKRVNDDRIYLEHADNLTYDQYGPQAGMQVARGNVRFLHKGSVLTCDSAYFNQQAERFEAFGHVFMKQGDTLTLRANYADYDGGVGREILHASKNVELVHKKKGRTVLTTDSLVYDRLYDFAYYLNNGKIVDANSELTSEWGEYHLDTRQATFVYTVRAKGKDFDLETDTLMYDANTSEAHSLGPTIVHSDGLEITTNNLFFNNETNWAHMIGPSKVVGKDMTIDTEDGYYNTKTEDARFEGPSTIVNKGTTINTTQGYYNTQTELTQLTSRSTVVNGDRIIVADTLYSDDKTGYQEGFGNVEYYDKKNKNELYCGIFKYNKKEGHGFATVRDTDPNCDRLPLMKDYSQQDTAYIHADSIRFETFYIDTDSMWRQVHAYPHARMYRKDVQAIADSIAGNSKDSVLILYRDPVIWHGMQQLVGDEIHAFVKDSTIERAHVVGKAFSIEKLHLSKEELANSRAKERYNQISSKEMWAYFENKKMKRSEAISNVLVDYFPVDEKDSSLIGMVYCETDTMRMYMNDGQLDKIWTSSNKGTMYPMNQIPGSKDRLPGFMWYDEIRPKDPDDIYIWKPKQ
ncbi:MAG: hypothetical protein HUK07_01240 [Bacteroidaceae bacterium]|nr:hypothetical protein [Bacteroidaceae bacterium]